MPEETVTRDAFGAPPAAVADADETEPVEPEPAEPAGAEPEPAEPEWAKYGATAEEAAAAILAEHRDTQNQFGRVRNELGEQRRAREAYERELEVYRQTYQAPQQTAQSDEAPLSEQELREWYEEDPFGASLYAQELRLQQFAQQFGQQLEPLYASDRERRAGSSISSLKEEFGDELVLRHREALAEVLSETDTEFYKKHPEKLHPHLRRTLQSLEYERLQGEQPRDSAGRYAPQAGRGTPTAHVEGGSTPPPPTAATEEVDPVIAEMDALRQESDLFGRRTPGL